MFLYVNRLAIKSAQRITTNHFRRLLMRKILLALCVIASSTAALSAEQTTLACTSNGQDRVQLKILSTEGDPSIKVLSLKGDLMVIAADPEGNDNTGKMARIEGLLVGKINQLGTLEVSGRIKNQRNSNVIINPESISAALNLNQDDTMTLVIHDEDRIFQRGFGLWLTCK